MVMWTLTVLTAEDLDKHVFFMSVYTLMRIFGKIGPSQNSTIIFDPWSSIFDAHNELADVKALAHLAIPFRWFPHWILSAICTLGA